MSCKDELRREMIKTRKVRNENNGEAFARMIRETECYKKARTVMVYMPINGESDVTALLEDDKLFVTPVTKKDDMYAAKVGAMVEGAFGVPEPSDKTPFDKSEIDVVIVPGVAFDKSGNRIGYGKGYYDRFLENMRAVKMGVCHSFQLVEKIQSDEHDVKMDMIVTEAEVWINANT